MRRGGFLTARRCAWACLAGLFSPSMLAPGAEPATQPRPVLTCRISRLDLQGERLISWFEGTRAPHPAAALAAWKHARGGRDGLGKPLEALIAAINPAMVRELRLLDGAEFRLDLEPGVDRPRWTAVVPGDDGSLAALVTALALTDGAALEPSHGVPLYRLGPPGAPLAATDAGRLAVASDRPRLEAVLRPQPPREPIGDRPAGLSFAFHPEALRGASDLRARRLFEALDAAKCQDAHGSLVVLGDRLEIVVDSQFADARPEAVEGRPSPAPSIDPAWLDAFTGPGVFAAAALAVEPDAPGLDALFALLDRVEKADPRRAGLAPLRTRLNLIAAVARVRPEVDLWPNLRGLSASFSLQPDGDVATLLVGLHAADPEAARRLGQVVLPRLAASYLRAKPSAAEPGGIAALGSINGRPLRATVRGQTVLVGWGDRALDEAEAAANRPDLAAFRASILPADSPSPRRAGILWPGRSSRLVAAGSPLARALEQAPPVVWTGRTDARSGRDAIRWDGPRGVVRRWLDALPLEPPPDQNPNPNPNPNPNRPT